MKGVVFALSLLCFPVAPLHLLAAETEKPNIILVITDDQGYGDLGATGNPVINTPNIDAMAKLSARMERFYVSPVCAPTRACLMTGRYNYRTRVIDTFMGRAMMEPSEITLAEALRGDGYATGIFGKWHLGDCLPLRAIDQGFDEALVHRGGGIAQPSEPLENNRRYTDPILFHNGKQVQTQGYCTDVCFEAANDWMAKQKQLEKPFFVYLPTNAPHGPFHDVPKALYEKYKAMDLLPVLRGSTKNHDVTARIYAMIENIDQNVGRLFRAIEAIGIIQNTIVIFMVDNGPNGIRYTGGFRGRKTDVYEGGIRSPFFMHWPGRLKAGGFSDALAAHIDVMPTLLDAAGIKVPEGVKLDGRSFLPMLTGVKSDWPDNRQYFVQSHRGDHPVRHHHFAVVEKRWKLVRPTGFGKYEPDARAPFLLFDLGNDPGEVTDLAGKHPEIVQQLKADYDRWFDNVSSTRPDNYAPPRIFIGDDRETTTVLTRQDWRVAKRDGWGSGGHWKVTAVRKARYEVTAIFRKKISGQAMLRAGKRTVTRTLPMPTNRVVMKDMEIAAGQMEVEFGVIHDDGKSDAYQVILRRL